MTILYSSSGRPYCTTDAKVQVVLPQLSELRLVALTKQLSRNRKQLYLTQGNLETSYLNTLLYCTVIGLENRPRKSPVPITMTILYSSSGRPYCTTDAKVQVVLPQLSELRLVALTKQLSRNRKQLYLTQGNLETDLKAQNKFILRENKLSDDRHTYISNPFKKSLFHINGVKRCLQRRKTELLIEPKNENFGQYGGLSVKSLKGDIDKIVKENSYQNVKTRHCKSLLSDGKADGRIFNVNLSGSILDSILKRPSMPMRRERALGFDLDDDDDEDDERQSTAETTQKVTTTTAFRLPPVTATRLFSPAKTQRQRMEHQAKAAVNGLDRAYTVA